MESNDIVTHILLHIGELIHDGMFNTGVARCAFDAARALSNHHRVTIAGTSRDGFQDRQLNANARLITSMRSDEDEVRMLRSVLASEAPDVVVCVVDHAVISVMKAFDVGVKRPPLYYWNHLSAWDYTDLPGLNEHLSLFSGIIVPTEHECSRISSQFPSLACPVVVIRNGIRKPSVACVTKDRNLLMFVGRRSNAKGYDIWIEVCRRIAEQRPAARFITVGQDGAELDANTLRCRAAMLAAGRLHEEEYVTPKALWSMISNAVVLVHPTRQDCAPICIIEAMYLGTPVVASNIPNLIEMAGTPPVLWLCHGQSPRSVILAIDDVLSGSLEVADRAASAGLLAEDRYSLCRCISELARVIVPAIQNKEV